MDIPDAIKKSADCTQRNKDNCPLRTPPTSAEKISLPSDCYFEVTTQLFTELMQRKMDQQSNLQTLPDPSLPSTKKLAEKHSKDFLHQVLHPRDIKIISETLAPHTLKSLQERIGSPDQSDLKRVVGNAFVEFDASEAASVFRAMALYGENEATHENEYRKYFLKSGLIGSIGTVCCCIQKKMTVDGSEHRTWIPRPVVTDRRKSGLVPSTMVWDFVHEAYPGKAGDNKNKDKYFVPDHVYAVNGRDEAEQMKIREYVESLPGFLPMEERNGMNPPYLIQESRDHKDKEREARQYLSLLTASALHDRMLLRWLSDEAQTNGVVALDPELCIYGMTCCGVLVTLYKMSIRDIWSNSSTANVGDPVRYDFVSVAKFLLDQPSNYTRLCDWMNTLHYYGRTSLADSMMQDGEKAYSGKKISLMGWKEQISRLVFLYGEEPNTATFSTTYTDIGNKDNDEDSKGNKDNEGGEDNEGDEDNRGGEDNEDGKDDEDNEDGADNGPPAPKRRKLSRAPCRHACRNQRLRSGRYCKHVCCGHGRERP